MNTMIEVSKESKLIWRKWCIAKNMTSVELMSELVEQVKLKKQNHFYLSLQMPSHCKRPLDGKHIIKDFTKKIGALKSNSTLLDNITKTKSRRITTTHIKNNELIKPERCELCNKKDDLDGHHVDYNNPLKIKWLCKRCHGISHSSHYYE